ncbi:MAG: PD-(D/E)XK nuclease family protein [Candidatus Aenigmatarchaeota archaeon]
MSEEQIRLSASSLGLMLDCKRCFWLKMVKKIDRPSGAFPSLPGGIDAVMKKHFDAYRSRGLPPELVGKVDGKLFDDTELINKWRNWRTGLSVVDKTNNIKLVAAFDDLLVNGDKFIPLDVKTKGWEPKIDAKDHYQHQLDVYAYVLSKNGYKVENYAYLAFYHPEIANGDGSIKFVTTVVKVDTKLEHAVKMMEEAVRIIEEKEPKPSEKCEFCGFREAK